MHRPALLLFALLLLAACTETVTAPGYCDACADEWAPACLDECGIPEPAGDGDGDGGPGAGDGDGDGDPGGDGDGDGDGDAPDAGPDGGDGDAPEPCDGACADDTPHCDEDTDTCVECRNGVDCVERDRPRCGNDHACHECLEDRDCKSGHCLDRVCVGCVEDAHCSDPARAACVDNACQPCAEDKACAHLGLAVCDVGAGECVECTVGGESACGGTSCDPATRACTDTPVGSVATCRACVADSECAGADARCVPLRYQAAELGGFCLRDAGGGCARPYSVAVTAASLSGAAEAIYCGIDQDATSCEALLGLVDGDACPGGEDAECSALGGLCRTVGVVANQCTYGCGDALQCPAGRSCGGGYCE